MLKDQRTGHRCVDGSVVTGRVRAFGQVTLSFLAGLLVVAGIWAFATATRGADARVSTCGQAPSGNVQAIFELSRAGDIWQRIPAFGKAPELEGNESPAAVVVFAGPIEVRYPGRADTDGATTGATETVQNIVCVIVGGVPTYYADIDLANSH